LRMRFTPSSPSQGFWWRPIVDSVLIASLAAIAVFGFAREWRAEFVTRPLTVNLGDPGEMQTVRVTLDRFSKMFSRPHEHQLLDLHGVLNTPADFLLTGGSCGNAALAMGMVFDQIDQPFRIIHINVSPLWGASHVMVEALTSDGKWLLLDPALGLWFPHPSTGLPMSLEEIRAFKPDDLAFIPATLRGPWSLWGPHRRTNWESIPIVGTVLVAVLPASVTEGFSLRAAVIEPGGGLSALALSLLFLLVLDVIRRAIRQRPAAPPVAEMALPSAVADAPAKSQVGHLEA